MAAAAALPVMEPEEERKLLTTQDLIDTFKVFLKGFSSGIGAYAASRVIVSLLRNPFTRRPLEELRRIANVDCLRLATFLGLYPAAYLLLLRLIRRASGDQSGWPAGLAGAAAGLTMFLEDSSRRRTVTLFLLARAAATLLSTLVSRGHLPYMHHADTATFCTAAGCLVYLVALKPEKLSSGYYRSVMRWSRDYNHRVLTVLFREPAERYLTCAETGLHEGGCVANCVKGLLLSFPAFAKLYLPIHLAPVLLFRRQTLKDRPRRTVVSILRNTLYSAVFLASMSATAKLVICLLRHVDGRPPPLPGYIPFVAGVLCGLNVLFERASRRRELALFVIPHLLGAVLRLEKGAAGSVLNTLLFALSMAPIMHAYERSPHSLSLLLRGVLRFLLPHDGSPALARPPQS